MGGPNQALFRIRAKDGTKFSITMGGVNSLPYAGDWDGNGKDKIGTYSKTLARFLLRNTNYPLDPSTTIINYGAVDSNRKPVEGHWL